MTASRPARPGAAGSAALGVLEATWLLTICVSLLATAWLWLAHLADIDFAAASWGVLMLGACYAALIALEAAPPAKLRQRLAATVHAAGVVALGYVWYQAGALQNPAFLLAFALPVVGAGSSSRRLVAMTAVLCVAVVGVVALIDVPEVRWYVAGLGRGGAWLARELAGSRSGRDVIAGFYAPSGYYLAALAVFAVLIAGCALAVEQLTTLVAALGEGVASARGATERAQDLGAHLIEQLPAAVAMVDANTLEVLRASDSFAAADWVVAGPAAGRTLTEAITFCLPDVVEDLVGGAGGSLRPCMVRVNGHLRALELRVGHLVHERRRVALLVAEDVTLPLCTRAALDAAEAPVLIVAASGELLGHNTAAMERFGLDDAATSIRGVVATRSSVARWWEPGLAGRRKAQVEVDGRIYIVTSCAVPLPGEADGIYVVGFAAAGAVPAVVEQRAGAQRPGEALALPR